MTNRSLRRETEKRVLDGKGTAGRQGRNDNLAAAGFCPAPDNLTHGTILERQARQAVILEIGFQVDVPAEQTEFVH